LSDAVFQGRRLMKKSMARAAALSLAIGMAGIGWTANAGAATRTLFDSGPVGFTARQAQRGQAAYARSCASCHGRHLNDGQFGPPMKGAAFRTHWSSQTPEALRVLIVQRMPPANPGSLDTRTYTDIEAYLLQENGDRPGSTELAVALAPAAPASNPGAAHRNPVVRTSSAARIDNRTPPTMPQSPRSRACSPGSRRSPTACCATLLPVTG
jgi:mono/diheme cytochrome c family protein